MKKIHTNGIRLRTDKNPNWETYIGIQGRKGDKGDKGDTGATGPQGPAGVAMAGEIWFDVEEGNLVFYCADANAYNEDNCPFEINENGELLFDPNKIVTNA